MNQASQIAEWIDEHMPMLQRWIDTISEEGQDEPPPDAQIFRTTREQPTDTLWRPNLGPKEAKALIERCTKDMREDVRRSFRQNIALALVYGTEAHFAEADRQWHYAPGFVAMYGRLPTVHDNIRITGAAMKEPVTSEREHGETIYVWQFGWIKGIELLQPA